MSVVFILSISTSYSQNENSNVDGGAISTTDDTTQCLNYAPNIVDVTLTGDSGMHSQWIITDIDNTILSLPDSPPFDFSNAGPGVCKI